VIVTTPTAAVSISTPGDREIRVERFFAASRERVWRALTDPVQLAEWWAPNNSRFEIERYELRRGGSWRFVEHGARGADGFSGRFREVTPPERLVYSFEWDGMPAHVMIHTVTLEAVSAVQTRMVTVVLCHTADECQGMLQSGMAGGFTRQYAALDLALARGVDP
jgi:uncharacterized protein YndB with AHSA1/START domain